MQNAGESLPLVSVIITTYNYADYLSRAIDSVLKQSYKNTEVIVIDDGSADDAASVIPVHDSVRYYYQENQGISAARNNGIKKSNGNYIIFLDADDWLEPGAIQDNLEVLINKPSVAFISGNYYFFRAEECHVENIAVDVNRDHYIRLLQSNYIGMLATVLFQKWVLNEIKFDANLKACEDYDLYLNIAQKYPVLHQQKFIATYYFHNKGLSHNYKWMMDSVTTVMYKQSPYVHTVEEKAAYETGLEQWKDYYALLSEKQEINIVQR